MARLALLAFCLLQVAVVASMAFGGTPVKVPVVAPGLRTPLSLSATQEKALEEENVEVLSPKELKQLKEWNEKVQKEEEEAEELEQQVVEKFLSDPERVRKVKEWAESMVKDNEEIRASTAAREEMMKGKDLFENDELIKMCRAYMRDPSTPVPEGLRPGPNGPATIGKIFEKAKAAKKLGDLRPDRLFRKLCGHLREISGNAQHWLLDKSGLIVEKGLPAMIVICHLPFMAKWVRSEEMDVDVDGNQQPRESEGAGPTAGGQLIG